MNTNYEMHKTLVKREDGVWELQVVSTKLADKIGEAFSTKTFETSLEVVIDEEHGPDAFEASVRKVKNCPGEWLINNVATLGGVATVKVINLIGAWRKNTLNHFKKNKPTKVYFKQCGTISKNGVVGYIIAYCGFDVEVKGELKNIRWYNIIKKQ